MLTLLLSVIFGPVDAGAADLQWRRGKAPAAQAVSAANAGARRDAAVRPAAWADTSGTSGQATLRSIVVRGDERNGSVRSDQLAQSEATASGTDSSSAGQGGAGNLLGTPPTGQPSQPAFQSPTGERGFESDALPLPSEQGIAPPGAAPQPPIGGAQPGALETLQPRDGATTQPFDRQFTAPQTLSDAEQLEEERRLAQELCAKEMSGLRASTLADVKLDITVKGAIGQDFPFGCSIDDGTWHAGRLWPETVFMWKASALCHKPLYFEEEALERYGHSWGPCCDPIISGAHFFTKLAVLPYCMGVEPPCECVYSLGHYRPGSCAPYMIDPIPISARGALFQAGAVVGAAAILP